MSLDLSLDLTERPDPGDARATSAPAPPAAPAPAGERARRPRPAVPVRPFVTAVLVSHDGAEFLPRSLAAIAAQTRAPDLLLAVDTGSRDQSPGLLAGAIDRVLRLPRRTSFGDAVQAGLTIVDTQRLSPQPQPRPEAGEDLDAATEPETGGRTDPGDAGEVPVRHWLWLLHDDAAPAPDALARLLDAVDTAPSAGVAGCKQVGWDDPNTLLEVGTTTSPLGKRVTGVDADDVDQGQLDHRSDVMAVCTAGMLVRRDVWDLLGGPDPALVHARDDLDLCRRAHLAGHRVIVVPGAVVAHAEGRATGRRRRGRRGSWPRADRRDALHLRFAAAPLLLVPLVLAWTVAAALLRATGRLALKQPDRAVDELAALGGVLIRPLAWWRAHRRVRRLRRVPVRAVRRLHARPRQVVRERRDAVSAHLRRQEAAWLAAEAARTGTAANPDQSQTRAIHSVPVQVGPGPDGPIEAASGASVARGGPAVETGPVADEAESLPGARIRTRARRPAPLLVVAAVVLPAAVAGLVGMRGLLGGSGTASSSVLLPAPAAGADLWRAALSSWRAVGLGAAAVADPLAAVLAALAAPLGSPRTAVTVLLVAAVPLSAFTAWLAASAATGSRALRAWASLVWAAAPTLLLADGAGRLGAVLAHAVLPLVALGLAQTVRAGGTGRVVAASWTGLALTVVLAGAPALAVPALIAVGLVAIAARSGRALLGWVVALPAVLLLPWWDATAHHPRLLLAEPGLPSGGVAGPPEAGWHLFLLPGDPAVLLGGASPPLHLLTRLVSWLPGSDPATSVRAAAITLTAPLLAVGLAALLRGGPRGRAAAVAWMVGLAGLAVAVLAPRIWVVPSPAGTLYGWWGTGVSLLLLGVLAAALCGLDGSAQRLRRRSLGLHHGVALGLGLVLVAGPIIALGVWSWHGWTVAGRAVPRSAAGPPTVLRANPDVLPAVAAAEAEGPAATRTLVIGVGPAGVAWNLLRAAGPRLGDSSAALAAGMASSRRAAEADDRLVLPVLGTLLSGNGADPRDRLADLDIGSVLMLPPVDDSSAVAVDAAPGLVRVGRPGGAVLWRVELAGTGGSPSRPARARVIAADGTTLMALPSGPIGMDTVIPAGPPGRSLVLAERAAPGWQARLDGRDLVRDVHAGWAQAFLLPTSGGHLVVGYRAWTWLGPVRLLVLGLALLAAIPLPGSRRRRVLAASRARMAAGPPGHGHRGAAPTVRPRRPGPAGRSPAPRVSGRPGRVRRRTSAGGPPAAGNAPDGSPDGVAPDDLATADTAPRPDDRPVAEGPDDAPAGAAPVAGTEAGES